MGMKRVSYPLSRHRCSCAILSTYPLSPAAIARTKFRAQRSFAIILRVNGMISHSLQDRVATCRKRSSSECESCESVTWSRISKSVLYLSTLHPTRTKTSVLASWEVFGACVLFGRHEWTLHLVKWWRGGWYTPECLVGSVVNTRTVLFVCSGEDTK